MGSCSLWISFLVDPLRAGSARLAIAAALVWDCLEVLDFVADRVARAFTHFAKSFDTRPEGGSV